MGKKSGNPEGAPPPEHPAAQGPKILKRWKLNADTTQRLTEAYLLAVGQKQVADAAMQMAQSSFNRYEEMLAMVRATHGVAADAVTRVHFSDRELQEVESDAPAKPSERPSPNGHAPAVHNSEAPGVP
jgi:hypothetical protein